jgi:S1-C subfamily serine protease
MADATTHQPEVEADGCPVCVVYEAHRASVVRVSTPEGQGTGLLVCEAGVILTNAHAVGMAKEVRIETDRGTMTRGRVVRTDTDADLALIKADATDVRWHHEPWDHAAPPRIGTKVFIIGHPLGLGWTVTEGLVSGTRAAGTIAPIDLIQTNAAINAGNSGGPVFDPQGRVVGLVRSKLVGSGVESISFVNPWGIVRKFIAGTPVP